MPAIRHACPVEGCTATLSRRADLKRHEAIHNKNAENLWVCPIRDCKRAMPQKSNMLTHIRNVHYSNTPPIPPRCPTKSGSRKLSSPLAHSVKANCVKPAPTIKECMGVFRVSKPYDIADVPCKAEEQDCFPGVNNTPASSSVPPLSPSSSVSDSTSSGSWEYPPCSDFGYTFPGSSIPTSSGSFDYYNAVSQSIPAPYFDYGSMSPEFFWDPSFNINVACPDPLSAPPVPENAFFPQYSYWDALSTMFVPACGLVNPMIDPQPELQDTANFDLDLSVNNPSAYFPVDEPSYGTDVLDASLEYQMATVDIPPVYPNTNDFIYDDLSVPSVKPTDYSNLDISYFDPSWNLSVPLDNFDALNYF